MMTLKELDEAMARRRQLDMRAEYLTDAAKKELSTLDNIRITSFSLDETPKDSLEKINEDIEKIQKRLNNLWGQK